MKSQIVAGARVVVAPAKWHETEPLIQLFFVAECRDTYAGLRPRRTSGPTSLSRNSKWRSMNWADAGPDVVRPTLVVDDCRQTTGVVLSATCSLLNI